MLSRRQFLGTVAGGAAMGAAHGADREHLREFAYSDVRLTGGPLKAQYDGVHAHFLSLDNDRLLKVYRQRAGLPAPGEDMGGWYDADGFVPGTPSASTSPASRACTPPRATVPRWRRCRTWWEGTRPHLARTEYPYASEKAAVTWPCYILDKYGSGMLDAHRLAGLGAGARTAAAHHPRRHRPYSGPHVRSRAG